MSVSELVDELGTLSRKGKDLYKEYKAIKEQEDVLRQQLSDELKATGLKSAKTSRFIASMAQRTDIIINHEQSVLEWLREEPNVEEDFYIGLKLTPFKTLAREVLKKTGEVIPGTETTINESLTIKGTK